jgi:hypothetical protein
LVEGNRLYSEKTTNRPAISPVVYVISQPPIIKFKFELSQVEKYRNPMVAEGGPVSPMTKNVNFLRLWQSKRNWREFSCRNLTTGIFCFWINTLRIGESHLPFKWYKYSSSAMFYYKQINILLVFI